MAEPPVHWAVASRPLPGEEESGDVATTQVDGSRCVLAVIDGLGHGAVAARSARLAAETVDAHRDESPGALLERLHRVLAATRGAAATVAVIDGSTGQMDWLGVGNVDGVVVRADDSTRPRTHGVFLCGGVLGDHLPALFVPQPLQLQPGDRIVLATDGVRTDLAAAGRSGLHVDRLAGKILDESARPDDDALVLVARYRGPSGVEVPR